MLFNKRPNTIAHIDLPMLIIAVVKGSKVFGKMTCIIKEETEGITISDIICKRNNKGYGSLMMNKLGYTIFTRSLDLRLYPMMKV